MFTGLIEEVGSVRSAVHRGAFMEIVVDAKTILDDVRTGDSISINGACQTVTVFDASSFMVQAVEETIRRTTLGGLKKGMPVNLERSLQLGDRLGGHLVQGHVDGVGRIVSIKGTSENKLFSIAVQNDIGKYIAEKGSVAIDGISLTVTFVSGTEFGVSVIPHTLGETTLGTLKAGSRVNIETDVIAKYTERLLGGAESLSLDKLEGLGY